jgi:hypothetical protein
MLLDQLFTRSIKSKKEATMIIAVRTLSALAVATQSLAYVYSRKSPADAGTAEVLAEDEAHQIVAAEKRCANLRRAHGNAHGREHMMSARGLRLGVGGLSLSVIGLVLSSFVISNTAACPQQCAAVFHLTA